MAGDRAGGTRALAGRAPARRLETSVAGVEAAGAAGSAARRAPAAGGGGLAAAWRFARRKPLGALGGLIVVGPVVAVLRRP